MALHIPPSLKHRNFLLLWTGLIISIAGSQMQVSAIHWHIRDLSDKPDPLALGAIGLARILPIILFSLVSGPVADTYNRKTILVITQTLQAGTAILLAILTFSKQINIPLIYIITAIQAGAMAFDSPARQAMIPNIVPEKDLPNAYSLLSIARNSGAIFGPLLGGIVIATLGQGFTYFFNAISFLAVIIALFLIGIVPQDFKHSAGIHLSAVKEGIQFIISKPIILSTMLIDFVATFFASAKTMLPIVARDILHVGEVGYGILSAGESIGSLAAGLVISQLSSIKKQGKVFLTAVILFGLATIVFGISQTLLLAFFSLVLIGAADSVSTIIRNTIRQIQTPDHLRGRMVSINQIFFRGGPQLGELEAGIVGSLFSVPAAIVSGGVGVILAVWWIAKKWPDMINYDGDENLQWEKAIKN
ncbi:MAG TPA: MFS transporter [Anaerolineales bacterium]|nr:MFS transporter [Anaerolineales bacterium]